MLSKIQLFVLRLAVCVATVGLLMRITTVALASPVDGNTINAVSGIVQQAPALEGEPPMDAWTILAPIENLASFAIRICIGLVGIAVAVGTYKNAAIANVAHQLSMSNPAAGALMNIGIGIGYFILFWILPGVIQYIYGQVVTTEAINNMTNLDWLHNVGGGTPAQ
jgi:hypothetical protein